MRLKKEVEALKASRSPLSGTPPPPPVEATRTPRPYETRVKGKVFYCEDEGGTRAPARGVSAESDVTIVGKESIGSAEKLFHRELTRKEQDDIWEGLHGVSHGGQASGGDISAPKDVPEVEAEEPTGDQTSVGVPHSCRESSYTAE